MSIKRREFLLGIAALGFPQFAYASDVAPAAIIAFDQGDWPTAAQLAARAGGAMNLSFAARAIATQISINRPSRAPNARMALLQNYSNRALAINPNNLDAKLMSALYDLFRASQVGPVLAITQRYPQSGKAKIDEILRVSPNNDEALALLGSWHFEVVRVSFGSASVIGASINIGQNAFENSIRINPHNLAQKFLYANSLILLDAAASKTRINQLLQSIASARPNNALDRVVKQRATPISTAMRANNFASAKNIAISYL